ncbi:hypothetical protein C0J52_19140 [Blattella germanica]|nr:hypothetical protein C0J52_19140 [Blattella germanica]
MLLSICSQSYFSHEGYLSGLTLNKNQTSLLQEYRRILRFYGYDVGMGPGHQFPPTTTKKPTTTTTTTTEPTTTETKTETIVEDLTTETITSTTASSERATETATEDLIPSTTTVKITTEEIIPPTTTEDIIPPTTPKSETTEDIIPPTTITQRTTTEDIIPPTTTTRTTTEDIIPPTTTTQRTTTEDIIPPTTTTRRTTTENIIPPGGPLGDIPDNFDYEVITQPPVKSSTPESVPQSTESVSKEMPEDTTKPTLPSADTPVSTEQEEGADVSTEKPEMEASTESTSVESASPTDSPVMTEVPQDEPTVPPVMAEAPQDEPTDPPVMTDAPQDEPVETIMPTEAPEEPPETVATTESEAEVISPSEITTLSNPPSTESNDETIVSTQDSTTPAEQPATETKSESPEEVMTTSTYPPELENTISSDFTDAATTTTEGPKDEMLAESMSQIVKTKVKFTEPIPVAFNSSKTTNSRIKRSLAAVVFPDISLQLQNGMFDSQVRGFEMLTQLPKRPFLVDGVAEELVPVMSYTAIFPFAYIRRLHAQVLEFPLDDERYKLLLILPVERRGLRQLIYDLSSCPLREVYQAMRPKRVQAIIPSFMVEGTMAARTTIERFAVTHPFLYFVMDTDTHVALMAGKVVDPLNSRIY